MKRRKEEADHIKQDIAKLYEIALSHAHTKKAKNKIVTLYEDILDDFRDYELACMADFEELYARNYVK